MATARFMRRAFRGAPSLILAGGLIAICFGSIFVRLCDAPALVIAAYRLSFSTVLLLPFFLRRPIKTGNERRSILSSAWVWAAGIFLAAHFAFWVTSLKYTTVASSVVLVSTNPIFVALLSSFVLREKQNVRAWLGIVIAIVGTAVIAHHDVARGQNSLLGDALALLGALMMSGYLLVGRALRASTELTSYLLRVYGTAAILLLAVSVIARLPLSGYSRQTFLFFFLSAMIPQTIGHTSINWALKYFPAAFIAVGTLIEPVGASMLAWWIFGEALTAVKVIGSGLILVGIALSVVSRGIEPSSPKTEMA